MSKHKPIFYLFFVFILIVAFIMILNFAVDSEEERYKDELDDPNIDPLFLECNQNVRLEITDTCYDKISTEVFVSIKNKGTIDIAGMNFLTDENFGVDKEETIVKKTTTTYVLVMKDKPEKIVVTPEILFEGQKEECTSINKTIENIVYC